jgi:Cutinase
VLRNTGRLAWIVFAAFAVMVALAGCTSDVGSLSAVSSAGVAQPAASNGCQPVRFIGARGSGEAESGYDGMGPEVGHMAQVVGGDLAAKGLGMGFTPVGYTAASVDLLTPSATVRSELAAGNTRTAIENWIQTSLDPYDASIGDGIRQTEEDAETAVSQCPGVKLILGGYSQGAIAVHDAEVWLAVNKPSVFQHVGGTLLLADPDRVPDTKAENFGDPPAAPGDEGVRTWLCLGGYLCAVTPNDVPAPSTTANIVESGDLVGDFKLSDLEDPVSLEDPGGPAYIHTHYAALVNGQMVYKPELATAANWVASLIP